MKPKLINSNKKLAFYALDNSKLDDIPIFGDAVPAGPLLLLMIIWIWI